mmetsp:Transcript_13693/g.34940  ORF Transcript_13693/g.34940 Transcript_13693/m.34940 type:complete len:832 (-) Transcript_13693:339-2834(-)
MQHRKTGRVVGIAPKTRRMFAATLQQEEDKTGRGSKRQVAVPLDIRIPKVTIVTSSSDMLRDCRIAVRIDRWDRDCCYPHGHYVHTIGPIGNPSTELQCILVENQVQNTPFTSGMLSALPPFPTPTAPYIIPQEDVSARRDMRDTRLFSIDPPGCEDVDDAVSIKWLPNGNVQVGVHIADVTAFLPAGCLLDVEARERSTTVYLVGKRFDMLPAVLSSCLCSLREKQDRLAVSVVWTLNKSLEVVETWFGRTVIHSAHELHYPTAQAIIDGTESEEDRKRFPDIELLRKELGLLMRFSRLLETERRQKGALELASAEIQFDLDARLSSQTPKCGDLGGDKSAPEGSVQVLGMKPKQELEVMRMVAQLMIFANRYVAQKIFKAFPNAALLRRHPFPRGDDFKALVQCAASQGFQINTSSNRTLAESLSRAVLEDNSNFNYILKSLATQAMSEAKYFCTSKYSPDDFYHYGLAAEFYTHFTSPIRRYADVIVHRMLLASISGGPPPYTSEELQEICTHLNERTRCAKQAQRDSVDFARTLFFKSNTTNAKGIICQILQRSLMIFIPDFGMKAIVAINDKNGTCVLPPNCLSVSHPNRDSLNIRCANLDEISQTMTIESECNRKVAVNLFEEVTVEISVGDSRYHLDAVQTRLLHFGVDPFASPSNRRRPNLANLVEHFDNDKGVHSHASHIFEELIKKKSVLLLNSRTVGMYTDPVASDYALFEGFSDMSLRTGDPFALPAAANTSSSLAQLLSLGGLAGEKETDIVVHLLREVRKREKMLRRAISSAQANGVWTPGQAEGIVSLEEAQRRVRECRTSSKELEERLRALSLEG